MQIPINPPSDREGIRACFVCTHRAPENTCAAFEVNGSIKADLANLREARSTSGPCGPEARFLKLKGE